MIQQVVLVVELLLRVYVCDLAVMTFSRFSRSTWVEPVSVGVHRPEVAYLGCSAEPIDSGYCSEFRALGVVSN